VEQHKQLEQDEQKIEVAIDDDELEEIDKALGELGAGR